MERSVSLRAQQARHLGGVSRVSAPADFNIGDVDPLCGHLSTPDVT